MKRGIFRIIAGVILILLQILIFIRASYDSFGYGSIRYSSIFYSAGCYGLALLIFGIQAFSSGERATLVLHKQQTVFDKVIRWAVVAWFAWELIKVTKYFISIYYFSLVNLFWYIFLIFFIIYLIFYYNKRACCLFSAALLFYSINGLSSIGSSIYYILDEPVRILQSVLNIINSLFYIIIAVRLYREKFSVKRIKILGYATFIIHILADYILGMVIYETFLSPLFLITPGIIFYYISIAQMNEPEYEKIVKCRMCKSDLLNDSIYCHKCGEKQ